LIRVFTMGFTKKNAEEFFTILKDHGVRKLIDIRLNNRSQLAGFTRGDDLKYFLKELAGIEYEHNLELAPTKELLKKYQRKEISWKEYEEEFRETLESREGLRSINQKDFDMSCLLCSEATPEKCHRRLVAEFIKADNEDVEVIHL